MKPEKEKVEMQVDHEKQMSEMKILFGDSAQEIFSLETAMQLKFDQFRDKRNPPFWPCIPLNL